MRIELNRKGFRRVQVKILNENSSHILKHNQEMCEVS